MAPESFRWLDLPVGPQPIPAWCKDLHVNWMDGYGNAPHVRLKVTEEAREWRYQRWVVEDNGAYRARHADGRLHQWVIRSPLTWDEKRQAWLTNQQEGLGGSGVEITMARLGQFKDGRTKVILRGPWCTEGPDGYHSVAYVDVNARWRGVNSTPWHRQTGMGGLMVTTDLLLRLVARFAPTVRAAAVTRRWAPDETFLELVREDWDAPKNMKAEQEVLLAA